MERRLQLLLDQERYDRVQREAERSGRSVAAVIREAIDLRFSGAAEARQAALRNLLEMTERNDERGRGDSWPEIKAALERDLEARHPE